MSEHFIILGLPRSMTAWVSCFLTCGDVFCQHEIYPKVSHDDAAHEAADLIRSQPFPVSGVCDSGLLPYWEGLVEEFPDAKFVFIFREIQECRESLYSIGLGKDGADSIVQRLREFWHIANIHTPNLTLHVDELQTEEGARRLWEYIAPSVPLPPAHLAKMMTLKVVQHPKVYQEAAQTLNALT